MKSPIMTDESQRLAALAEYHIMDSAPEEAYDDLVAIASHICGCPIATITFVDDKRLWFKARIELENAETLREHSFCAQAILEPENLMVVNDATLDMRFASNPLVTARSAHPFLRRRAPAHAEGRSARDDLRDRSQGARTRSRPAAGAAGSGPAGFGAAGITARKPDAGGGARQRAHPRRARAGVRALQGGARRRQHLDAG